VKIHHLQHVPFEGLGTMESYFLQRGYQLSSTHFYLGNPLPSIAEFDWLIVMGGSMGIYDEIEFPWLNAEKSFIQNCHGELDGSKYVQSAAEIQSDKSRFLKINGIMNSLLEKLENQDSGCHSLPQF
jgi:hypothetical protein